MNRHRVLFVVALIVAGASQLAAQRVDIGRDPFKTREPRRPHLYDRPIISPWVGLDAGLGVPMARCASCDVTYMEPGIFGSLAAGVTLFSRATVALERSDATAVFYDDGASARMTMVTGRFGTRRGLLGKAGVGTARFTRAGARLVADERAVMIGGEVCNLSRIDGCGFVDYSSANGDQYRLHALRVGFALRLHLLRGHRVTLPPRA